MIFLIQELLQRCQTDVVRNVEIVTEELKKKLNDLDQRMSAMEKNTIVDSRREGEVSSY